jgi:hypothetical protein
LFGIPDRFVPRAGLVELLPPRTLAL